MFGKQQQSPSYDFKRAQIKKCKDQFGVDVLVETGTFIGDTVEHFKTIFKKVYSIELAEELAAKAKRRFESDRNVTIIQGDSSEVLDKLIDQINEPILFWLDGHYSSEFYLGDEYIKTGRGKKDTPVEEELKLIFRNKLNHVILIDDARLFQGINDYPSIPELKKLVKSFKRNYSVKVDNDIIYILPETSI
jgi:hypothetical protein